MRYLIICLQQQSIEELIYQLIFLSFSLDDCLIQFTASSLVFDGLKNISQWGEVLGASTKQQIDIGLTVFDAPCI